MSRSRTSRPINRWLALAVLSAAMGAVAQSDCPARLRSAECGVRSAELRTCKCAALPFTPKCRAFHSALRTPHSALLFAAGPAASRALPSRPGRAVPGPPPFARYERLPAADIKAETKQVLADPRFTDRVSFWGWLLDKLSDWRLPQVDWGSDLARVVLWVVTIACVMTLAAILAHLGWTIAMLLGIGGHRRDGERSKPHFGLIPPDATYKELEALRRRLARDGRFREAIGVMMVSLLRWLESRRVIEVHPSKTNGDYVREFPRGRPEEADFRRFVRTFDGTAYGGTPCEAGAYSRMDVLFQEVRAHGREEP